MCALVTGVQTCALPIYRVALALVAAMAAAAALLDAIKVLERTALGGKTDLAFAAGGRGVPRHHAASRWRQAATARPRSVGFWRSANLTRPRPMVIGRSARPLTCSASRARVRRSDERRVGDECVSTGRTRCAPYRHKNNNTS